MSILLFNPSMKDNAGTLNDNLGDIIISQAVSSELETLFPNESIISIASHSPPGKPEKQSIKSARHRIVGGTNLLSSDMRKSRQWLVPGRFMAFRFPAVLCGVGWHHYQEAVTRFTKTLLQCVLSRKGVHSVRDDYTRQKLLSSGICNVINTSCPTLWKLAGQKVRVNEQPRGESVLLMLTDYRRDPEADAFLVSCLCRYYKTIFFWPQGRDDFNYLSSLVSFNGINLVILNRTIEALDECLACSPSLDYVGTRLHGGIRCLHAGKRTLILEVDNRTAEIAKETGLPALPRTDLVNIEKWVNTGWASEIHVDEAPIKQWRQQFSAS